MVKPDIYFVPLVQGLTLPKPSSAQTRPRVPPGPGVQEHCLPFTAASALGLIVPSPIQFGCCGPSEVPAGARSFRPPTLPSDASDGFVFYVADDPECRFIGNAFTLGGADGVPRLQEPGLSFFDRPDQHDLFKLHLPYIWRTTDAVDTLFGPLINRAGHGLEVVSGLVETDWYASPINLVLRRPAAPFHVRIGDAIAHAILIPRSLRRPAFQVLAEHSRVARDARKQFAEWEQLHAADHAAYKALARSNDGRIDVTGNS